MDADLASVQEARDTAERAFSAWERFRGTPPARVDAIVEAVARAAAAHAAPLARLAADETQHGNARDKTLKNLFNASGVAAHLRTVTTLGVLWRDEKTKVAAVGEPMGLVAALIPVTNPTSTVIFKTLSAIKAGNAVVHAPHPRAVRCCTETARVLAEAAEAEGAPAGLIGCLAHATIEGTQTLMRHPRTAVIMATGGADMVRAAYSCGKPTLAVGPGNVPVYVDPSAGDLREVADRIIASKSFDWGTACVAEQAIVVHRDIARDLRPALRDAGAYLCSAREAEALAAVLFDNGRTRVPAVGQSPTRLAALAGFAVPASTRVLVAELTNVGADTPLSLEKLAPVLALYEAASADDAYRLCLAVLELGGLGHTLGLHATDPEVVARFAALPAARVVVNTPTLHGGMGFSADLDPSFMLGTGTWSGSIVSDNVTALHLINIKRIAWEQRPWRDFEAVYALPGEASAPAGAATPGYAPGRST